MLKVCNYNEEYYQKYVDGQLSMEFRQQLEKHARECVKCSKAIEAQKAIMGHVLADVAKARVPSEEILKKIKFSNSNKSGVKMNTKKHFYGFAQAIKKMAVVAAVVGILILTIAGASFFKQFLSNSGMAALDSTNSTLMEADQATIETTISLETEQESESSLEETGQDGVTAVQTGEESGSVETSPSETIPSESKNETVETNDISGTTTETNIDESTQDNIEETDTEPLPTKTLKEVIPSEVNREADNAKLIQEGQRVVFKKDTDTMEFELVEVARVVTPGTDSYTTDLNITYHYILTDSQNNVTEKTESTHLKSKSTKAGDNKYDWEAVEGSEQIHVGAFDIKWSENDDNNIWIYKSSSYTF